MPGAHRPLAALAVLLAGLSLHAAESATERCWTMAAEAPEHVEQFALDALATGPAPAVASELHLCRGHAFEQRGDVSAAARLYETAVTLADRSGDLAARSDALLLRGALRHYRGEFATAIEDLQKAYAINVERGKVDKQLFALTSIANLYADPRVGAHDRAIEYYRQVLDAHERAGNEREVATAHFNIGATLDTKGAFAAALNEFRLALALERARGASESIAEIQRARGSTLTKLGRHTEALTAFDEAMRYFTSTSDAERTAQLRLSRAATLLALGRPHEAARDLESARERFAVTANNRYLEKTHERRAEAFAALGDWRRAHDARKDQLTAREHLTAVLRDEQVYRMRVQFETEKKERENQALARENRLNAAALASAARIRRLQTIVIALTVSLVLLLIGVAWRMRRLALTDELTRLPNRRHVMHLADRRFRSAETRGSGYALLALDIDHFKRINDTLGHPAGDLVLRRVAQTCRAALRRNDRIGRIGGEEFLVVLPATGASTALEIGERLRRSVEAIDMSDISQDLKVTISVGVSARSGPENLAQLARQADDSLYRAKSLGRNRVEALAS